MGCEYCSEIAYFNQVAEKYYYSNNILANRKRCKLCGKLIYEQICSNDGGILSLGCVRTAIKFLLDGLNQP